MANKRTRKKQIKKQQDRSLKQLGYSSKQISKLQGSTRQKVYKHEIEKKRKRDNYHMFRSLGFDSKESNRMKSWKPSRIESFLSEFNSKYLLVVYKDVTEETDSEALYLIKNRTKKRSTSSIKASIKGWLRAGMNQGYIGGYEMEVGNKEEIAFHQRAYHFRKYLQAYHGQGKQLKPLLNLLENMMVLLYTVEDKDEFVLDLIKNLRRLPYPEAHANADYIEEEFDLEESANHF
ncbi:MULTISPECIES: hypothetical protein [Bacillus]|jgi:hypothetical protein|uniref:Hypothetical cytosolic protein n=4 Tax=Bacillus cereus TaxID=1396 RepID=Q814E8_BACCR|nr:hypothetical protein [Bacillus cereus]AAP12348.1 hypothetical cytosolic protein [Bacillus cereus ATCC 14579]MCC3289152.1 cytoplasmic protein [Bacillus cereus]OOR43299.1 cytoplasmic protein [Bacillus cereus]QCX97430.1 cytoplasmic protein [Bacillus cereus ATCC 14579]WPD83350.1 cytoplasmic protein [Bacillus cereus ATCC 14579]